MEKTVTVLGAGSFGVAVSGMLLSSGSHVRLWAFREEEADEINSTGKRSLLPDCDLTGAYATSDVAKSLEGSECAIVVCPSFGVADLVERMKGCIGEGAPVLVLTKGLEPRSGKILYEFVAETLGLPERVAVLSGPNHAEEIVRREYAGAVVASSDAFTARFFQHLLSSDTFRLYSSDDPVGVSLCGAAKNVVAIACGMARGMGLGDNSRALLMTRGLHEIAALVEACGGRPETCLGLAGVGDLDVTCNSPYSRNRAFGEAFAREGISVLEYEKRRGMVVEGAYAVAPLLRMAVERGVEMPVAETVSLLLAGKMALGRAAEKLMGRSLKLEY